MPVKLLELLLALLGGEVGAAAGAEAKRLAQAHAKHGVGAVGVDARGGQRVGILVHADDVRVAHLDLRRPRGLVRLRLLSFWLSFWQVNDNNNNDEYCRYDYHYYSTTSCYYY